MLPRCVGPYHGVQDREELAHTGDERDFLRFAGRDESTIEGANDRVPSGRDAVLTCHGDIYSLVLNKCQSEGI